MMSRGWDVTALVPHHRGLKVDEIWDGIRVTRFKYLPEPYENLAYSAGIMPGVKKKPWKALKVLPFIYSMYHATLDITKKGDFDLVNFHWLFPAGFWIKRFARKRRLPVVLTGHGTDIHLALKRPFDSFARKALKNSAALTLNSEYMRSVLNELPLPDRTEIIPMGVDTERFSPGEKAPSHSKKILFVGRVIRQKGIEELTSAFSSIAEKVPGSRLEIIGHGPESEKLVEQLSRLDAEDSVIITDPIPHADLAEKYRGARALVLPSLIPEGLGMTAVEAGACGVPTITFGLGGTREFVINEETGLVVDKRVRSLAAGIERILTDGDLADRLGNNARKKVVESYGWAEISRRFDALYRSLIE